MSFPPPATATTGAPQAASAYTTDLVPVVRGGLIVLVPIAALASPSNPPGSNAAGALLLLKVL